MQQFPLLSLYVRLRQFLGWGSRPARAFLTNIAEVRADAPPQGNVSLGLNRKDHSHYAVEPAAISRHIGVFGSLGVGCHAYVHYLLVQQVSRGDGYLYLDLIADESAKTMLATAAQQGGLEFQALESTGNVGVPLDLTTAAGVGRGVYVALPQPALHRSHPQAWICRQIEAFVDSRQVGWMARTELKKFFIVVPGVSFLYSPDFPVLMQRARSAGVVFIFLETVLKPFDAMSDAETEAVLQNTGTKVFFRMGSPATARSAAKLLAPHAAKLAQTFNRPSVRMSDVLLTLGLGEAVALNGAEAEVVRVPLVNIA